MSVSLVGLLCRTSDRTPHAARGVEALAPLIGKRLGREPRLIGSPGDPRDGAWDADLAESRGCLLEAGGQVDDALAAGDTPLLLGERISAEEAKEAGIVNRVVPAGELGAAVDEWAVKLASKSPVLMRLGKEAMYRQLDMSFEDALDYLRSQLSLTFTTEDIVEGVTAFFEKREPQWKGR